MPDAVKFVVLAPPFMEKMPEVMVDDAFERKPPVKSDATVVDVATT